MSRRYRHGRPPHKPHRAHGDAASRPAPAPSAPETPAPSRPVTLAGSNAVMDDGGATTSTEIVTPVEAPTSITSVSPTTTVASVTATSPTRADDADAQVPAPAAPSLDVAPSADHHGHRGADADGTVVDQVAQVPAGLAIDESFAGPSFAPVPGSSCTTAQLRRFIKSRPWVPMHELRRRFAINGTEDEVAAIDVSGRRVFVGLPAREATQLGELVRTGDIGVELSLDPGCPMVIGVYPMRPIPRG